MAPERRFPGWVRHSGVGLEFAAAIAGFALVGYWIDSRYDTEPWGIVVGLILGMMGGLYNLVKQAMQAQREARREDAEASVPHQTDDVADQDEDGA